jgi:hypothetical protein
VPPQGSVDERGVSVHLVVVTEVETRVRIGSTDF